MAASLAMILDAAAGAKPDRAGDGSGSEPSVEGRESGAAMAAVSHASTPPPANTSGMSEDSKRFAVTGPVGVAATASATPPVPSEGEGDSQPLADDASAALVVDTSVTATTTQLEAVVAAAEPVKKVTPTGSRPKSAKSALGISTPKKKTKKKKASHPSIGMSVDALDKKKIWGNGRIVEVNAEEQRLKITFPGFNAKKWDIWTDMLSIAPHCRFSQYPRTNARSWDGRTNLFTGERITLKDDEEDDVSLSPKRTEPSPPAKPTGRKPKKGYVIELVVDGEPGATTSPSKQPAKTRKSSATLKREAATQLEDIASPVPKKARVKKEHRVATTPPAVHDPYTDAELARQRAENASALDRSAAFLSHCATLWKLQLTAMTEMDRKALSTTKLVDEAGDVQSTVV